MPENRLGIFDTGTVSSAYCAVPVLRGQRLVLTSGPAGQGAPTAAIADATTPGQGVADSDNTPIVGVAHSYYIRVHEYNNGSFPCLLSTVANSGDKLYPDVNGKVSNAAVGGNAAFAIPLRTGAAGDTISARPQLV